MYQRISLTRLVVFVKRTRRLSILSRSGLLLVLHSHITITEYPKAFNSRRAFRSLAIFLANFPVQNSTRVFGVLAASHPSWRCQKHPWTTIAFFRPVKTISGLPGSVLTFIRYDRPKSRSIRRTTSSGVVPLWRTRLISLERLTRAVLSWSPASWSAPRLMSAVPTRLRDTGRARFDRFAAGASDDRIDLLRFARDIEVLRI
jgi:hypothetical protein